MSLAFLSRPGRALLLVTAVSCGEPATTAIQFDLRCEDPVAITQPDGAASGFVRCADGFVHRQAAVECTMPAAPASCASDGSGTDTCTTSADCDERPDGACLNDPSVLEGCGCVYGCRTDADCATGEVCACAGAAGEWPTCIPAGCQSGADCDGLCGLSARRDGCSGVEYELGCLEQSSACRVDCDEAVGCYDNPGIPACEIVSGEWTCNLEDLCEDCG